MKVQEHSICQIPKLKLSCWGCCGDNFKSKEEIYEQIQQNTFTFKKIKIPSTIKLLIFRDRFSDDNWKLTPSGICSNLVKFNNGVYACPLHQSINKIVPKSEFLAIHKKDLRWNHCDVNYKCETIIFFKKFSEQQKKEYIKWIGKQKFNNYEYSTQNIKGTIIKKFLTEKNYLAF